MRGLMKLAAVLSWFVFVPALAYAQASITSQYSHSNNILLIMNARPRNGLTFHAGFDVGNTVQDNCGVRALLPELNNAALVPVGPAVTPTNPYCHTEPGLVKSNR